jgi:adenine-specific DNA-methyltransferase
VATNLDKLRDLLQELFQLDQADLDFGIYRIMNQKRDEIVRFLDRDLLPQVQAAFAHYQSADKSHLQGELDRLVANITSAGMNPDDSPRVAELRHEIAASTVDVTALENEVFSHLFNFFRRYYSEGDFISQRRYKEGVYAIPYEGEEVKLHWANVDQYYVKSSETFRDYTFKINMASQAGLPREERRVHLTLVAGSTEQDNNKAAQGKERRFVLADNPISEENGELFIRFEYRPHDGKEKQDELNKRAIDAILKRSDFQPWTQELGLCAPTEKRRERTVLEKHLTQYTARNTFDYFIHKDLGGFLRRELDFYIKSEVMHLDDIEHESAPKVEQYLSQIKVIRTIAHKIIAFISQLETFQKNLWLKAKFVTETNYCITLDQVPESLYSEIAANDVQRNEWVHLFAIDEIKRDLNQPGYSEPLKVEFLKAHSTLPIDTRHFSSEFKTRLLATLDRIDERCDGLLINSENFQSLHFLQSRYRNTISCVYIDPPYNSDAGPITYKNGYRHSSWIALIENRLRLSRRLLNESAITCVTIDDCEAHHLRSLFEVVFPNCELLGVAPIKNNPAGRTGTVGFSICHEYAFFYGHSEAAQINRLEHSEAQKARYKEKDELGFFEWTNFRKHGGVNTYRTTRPRQYYPIYVREAAIRIPRLTWDNASRQYIVHDKPETGEEVLYPIDSKGNERIWDFVVETARKNLPHLKVRLDADGKTGVYRKWRINEEGLLPQTWWDKSEYSAVEYGTNLLARMFGTSHAFMFPKSLHAVIDCLKVSGLRSDQGGTVLDYFAGSGTTGHAVICLNREDGGSRKYVLAEMGGYFDSVLVGRLKRAVYASEWKNGKPVDRNTGVSHCFKYIRLESYEDALNNLELKRTDQQGMFLDADAGIREQYILSYMLDVESRGSQSLLNVQAFRNPDEYKLKVERNGETQLVNVDLVETFNWLLGLTVKHIDLIRGVRVVEGTAPNGDRVLVLWRNIDQLDNDALDQWFEKQDYNTREMVYDVFYVNGDNNLENLRRPDQTWKVRLIENEFQRLMFAEEDL